MPYRPCAPRGCTRKPVITSSKMSTAPCRSQTARSPGRNPGRGMIRFMLPTIGSTMMHGDVVAVRRERGLHRVEVVVRQHDRLVGDRRRHAGRRRLPEGQRARARLHEQAVAVTVVAALELHDLAAAREAAREAQRGHRRLGARGHEAHHLDRRQQRAQRLRHFDLELGRRAERQAVRAPFPARRGRPPGAHGRGSPAPTSRRSRCSACRRHPTGTRLRRARRTAACRRRSGRRGPAN